MAHCYSNIQSTWGAVILSIRYYGKATLCCNSRDRKTDFLSGCNTTDIPGAEQRLAAWVTGNQTKLKIMGATQKENARARTHTHTHAHTRTRTHTHTHTHKVQNNSEDHDKLCWFLHTPNLLLRQLYMLPHWDRNEGRWNMFYFSHGHIQHKPGSWPLKDL